MTANAKPAGGNQAIVSRYRVRQVPVSNTPKRLRNISSSQKKSRGDGSSSGMQGASSIKVSAMPKNIASPPVYYEDDPPRAKGAAATGSPGQHEIATNNIKFHKNSLTGLVSQEHSLTPAAMPTPQLSIQQDSQKRNVYHIFGKESRIDLQNQKHAGGSLSHKNSSVAAPGRRGGKVILFESINQYEREAEAKLAIEGARTADGGRARA